MQRLEVSGAVRLIYGSLDVKRLSKRIESRNVHSCRQNAVGDTTASRVSEPVCEGTCTAELECCLNG